jgi:two-component system, response regulator YesN
MAGEKILVVDDSKAIREIFVTAFDEYSIVTADGGTEALRILNRPNDIDLVILDVMMPDANGLELLKEIKRINPGCKTMIMTGYSSKDIVIEALRRDADEYIEKPFDIENTRQMLRGLLGERKHQDKCGVEGAENKIKLAQRLVKRNYNKPFSLQDISEEVFLSYKYLSRLFKEKTGKNFNEYRLGLKMASAKQFLKERNFTVSQIAYKVGYHNPDSFMKMFKRSTGFTPSQYRYNNK